MPVYIIAYLKFTDLESYRTYQAALPKVFAKSKGTVLTSDESPRVLEGEWEHDKVVVLSFPSEEDALAFHNSDEYQLIARDRKAGAETTVLLARQFAYQAA